MIRHRLFLAIYNLLCRLDERYGKIDDYEYETAPYCGHHYSGHNGSFTYGHAHEGEGVLGIFIGKLHWRMYDGIGADEPPMITIERHNEFWRIKNIVKYAIVRKSLKVMYGRKYGLHRLWLLIVSKFTIGRVPSWDNQYWIKCINSVDWMKRETKKLSAIMNPTILDELLKKKEND